MRISILFSIMAAVAYASDPCLKSQLPSDLDLIAEIERMEHREIHITGEYRLEPGAPGEQYDENRRYVVRDMHLNNIKTNMLLRITVAPKKGVEMVLQNVRANGTVVHSRESSSGFEKSMFLGFTPDTTRTIVRFKYMLADDHEECPTVHLEMTYCFEKMYDKLFEVPVASTSAIESLTIESPPTKELYSWEAVGTVTPKSDEVEFLQTSDNQNYIPISIPHNKGRRGEWLIRVVFSTDFMMNGDCTAIITTDTFNLNLCGTDESFEDCLAREDVHGKFLIAAASRGQWQNTFILQTVLSSRDAATAAEQRIGSYKLWLFKRPQYFLSTENEVGLILPYNVKITLSQVQEEEDPLNCDSIPLPEDLTNTPGYYDAVLHSVHLHQTVSMNRTTGVQKTIFKPTVRSLMRLSVAHPTESILTTVWVIPDGGGNKKLIAQSFEDNTLTQVEPSGIVLTLLPDQTYEIWFTESNIINFDNELDENELTQFCDSFMCRLDVVQHPIDQKTDSWGENKTPDIPFDKILEKPWQMSFEGKYYHKSAGWEQEGLGSFSFEVKQPSSFSVTAERDFIIGDIQIIVYPKKEGELVQEDELILSKCGQRASTLDTILQPGYYVLVLETGPTQQQKELADDFPEYYKDIPKFTPYSLVIEIEPAEVEVTCPVARPLPSTIATGGDDGIADSGYVHMNERFTIPKDGKHAITFKVITESVLHVVAEYTLALDMQVTDSSDKEVEKPKVGEGRDPFILINLKAGETYTLHLELQKTDTFCQYFIMQFSIAPAFSSDAGPTQLDCEGKVPSNVYTDVSLPMPYTLVDNFSTKVSDLRTAVRMTPFNFKVEKETEFKSVIHYNFKHGSVNLLLCGCSVDYASCEDCTPYTPKSTFNGDKLRAIINPGMYQLRIIEATAAPLCQSYRLEIYMDELYRPGKNAAAGHNCMHQFLSKNLNIPGQLVKNEIHALGEVRVDSKHFQDATQFTVTEKVILRIWVPPSEHIKDVSVFIVISKRNDDGTRIPNVHDITSREGEAVVVPLDAGKYVILLKYDAVQEVGADSLKTMPQRISCASNPFEISIVPYAVIQKEELGIKPCDAVREFPKEPVSHGHDIRNLIIGSEDGTTYKGITETITWIFGDKGGRVEFDMYSTFETASLHFHVTKEIGGLYENYYPQRYLDRDYLYLTFSAGVYSFVFTSDDADGVDNLFKCSHYSLHLSIKNFSDTPVPTAVPTPEPPGETAAPMTPEPVHVITNECPAQNNFPFDMTEDSSKERFLFMGNHFNFLQADPLPPHSVRLEVDGFVRVWTHTHNTKVDIDLEIEYDGEIKQTKTTKNTHVETLSFNVIDATTKPYDIKVLLSDEDRHGDYSSLTDCDEWAAQTTFDYSVGIMRNKQIEQYTTCPSADTNVEQVKDVYHITSEGLNVKVSSYYFSHNASGVPMQFVVGDDVESADVTIIMRYDFILFNLHFELLDLNEFIVPIAVGDGELDINGEFTASSYLTVPELKPGTYVLDMSNPDEIPNYLTDLVTSGGVFCVPFEFEVQATTKGAVGPEYKISSIEPISGNKISATEPIELRIAFSAPVDKSLSDQDGKAVRIKDKTTGEYLDIVIMNYEDDIVATYTFANIGSHYPLSWDTEYELLIEASSFKSRDGAHTDFKIGLPIDTSKGDLIYKTSVGGCDSSGLCYWGGECNFGIGCVACINMLPPVDGKCPYKKDVTPIPTSPPIKVVTPPPTPQPTPAPTPVPTGTHHVISTPNPTVAPPKTPNPTSATTNRPDTLAPASKTTNAPVDNNKKDNKSSGGSGTTVVVVLLVIALVLGVYSPPPSFSLFHPLNFSKQSQSIEGQHLQIIKQTNKTTALAYVAHTKGWISTSRYRNPYGPAVCSFLI